MESFTVTKFFREMDALLETDLQELEHRRKERSQIRS